MQRFLCVASIRTGSAAPHKLVAKCVFLSEDKSWLWISLEADRGKYVLGGRLVVYGTGIRFRGQRGLPFHLNGILRFPWRRFDHGSSSDFPEPCT